MFGKSPTCPGNKVCQTFGSEIEEKTNQKAAHIIYPSAPELDHRMHEGTVIMINNHKKVCEMYFKENRSYFYIAANLHVPAHIARNYLDRHVKGRERYE